MKKNRNATLLISACVILAFLWPSRNVYAQVSHTYSLSESIRLALDNNRQTKNSTLDVQASDYKIKEVKSALLPTVDINGQYLYYMQVPSQYAPASAFGGPEGQYSKLTLNLPQTTSANIQLSQSLFNQQVLAGIKTAKVAQEATRLQATLTKEEIIYQVAARYYTIQILQDNLSRLQENIRNLEHTATINESLKNNDLVADNVHNRLLINLENLINQYQNQQLAQEKNIALLKYLMNVPASDSLQVEAFQHEDVEFQLLEADIAQRPDIQLQQAQVKLAKYEKKSVLAGYYPVLMGGLSYGYASYYNEFSPTRQINNDWINNSSLSLTLKIPVFDGFQKHFKTHQKEVAIKKNINTLELMKANAEKEVQDAGNNFITHANLVISSQKSLLLAEQVFNSARSEFENGITSTTELLNAQNDLTSARTNYSTALLNLKLAELDWKKASGTLLQEYSIN